jgi:hypothetical protein
MAVFGLDLSNHSYCIVGEAHGFNDDYTRHCTKCDRFSSILYQTLSDDPGDNTRFSNKLNGFVTHFESEHQKT